VVDVEVDAAVRVGSNGSGAAPSESSAAAIKPQTPRAPRRRPPAA
jgi:hypothetical protein